MNKGKWFYRFEQTSGLLAAGTAVLAACAWAAKISGAPSPVFTGLAVAGLVLSIGTYVTAVIIGRRKKR